MQYRSGAKLDSSQMGSGGGRRGTTVALGGGAAILVAIVAMLFGLNPSDLLGGTTAGTPTTAETNRFAHCKNVTDISKDRDCRFVAYTNSIQAYWAKAYSGYQQTADPGVRRPDRHRLRHGDGSGRAVLLPRRQGRLPRGHLLRRDAQGPARRQGRGRGGGLRDRPRVRPPHLQPHRHAHQGAELPGHRAEVGAGAAGAAGRLLRRGLAGQRHQGPELADRRPSPPTTSNRAVDAAKAVGDDRIQLRSTGQVSPESWTHGSSAMRRKWLAVGFNSGDPNTCDTFAATAP